jgi:hypothetical protein
VAAQEDRFAAERVDAPQALLDVPHEGEPRGPIGSGVAWPIVPREHAANGIFVDIDPKGVSDLRAMRT